VQKRKAKVTFVLGTTFADSHVAANADKQPDLDDLFAELEKDVSQPAIGTIWLEYLQTKLTKFIHCQRVLELCRYKLMASGWCRL